MRTCFYLLLCAIATARQRSRRHEKIRHLSEMSGSRSRMHVARGRTPRDVNAHMPRTASRIACSMKSHGRYRFPARFRARGKNNTNKQVARKKQYRAK